MPLLEDVPHAAEAYFERTAARLAAASTPKPKPQPLLRTPQTLARISPQPDRLVTVKAARVPLIEAARPLLEALARMPAKLDGQGQDDFYRALVSAIKAFQSVAQDARIQTADTLAASYMLCAALDEAIAHTPWATANETTVRHWAGRLSIQFHGANNGGDGFFLLLGRSAIEPAKHVDLLELMLLILVLGFEGLYRGKQLGQQRLDDVRHKVYAMVYRERKAEPSPRWSAIERLLKGHALDAVLPTIAMNDLFA